MDLLYNKLYTVVQVVQQMEVTEFGFICHYTVAAAADQRTVVRW